MVRIDLHDVSLNILSKKFPWSKSVPVQVLKNVSGTILSGKLTALMGASGSGKTTLLNHVAKRTGNLSHESFGRVLFDNVEYGSEKSQVRTAYVTQQDFLISHLTVRESLRFAAELCLHDKPKQARLDRVDAVIRRLGLTECVNTLVGDDMVVGCSGGERRRLSIGLQLLTEPQVLFLDEPTSGLDAFTSLSIVTLLKELALSGMTIVIALHQPRADIFELFDRVLLMAKGKVIYDGNRDSIESYFAHPSLSLPCPIDCNLADHIIDIAAMNDRSFISEAICAQRITRLQERWEEFAQTRKENQEECTKEGDVCSDETQQVVEASSSQGTGTEPAPPQSTSDSSKTLRRQRPANFFVQLFWLMWRFSIMLYRDKLSLLGNCVQAFVILIFLGFSFFQLEDTLSAVKSRTSLLYLSGTLVPYVTMTFQIYIQTRELRIFDQDRQASTPLYSPPAYLIARMTIQGFLLLLVSVLSSLMLHALAGLRSDPEHHRWIFVAVLIPAYVFVIVLATFCSALSRSFAMATLVANTLYTFFTLGSGFFIHVDTFPVFLNWVKYISYLYYTFTSLASNEFAGRVFDCPFPAGDPQCAPFTGRFILNALGMGAVKKRENFAIIMGISLGVFIATIFILWLWKPSEGLSTGTVSRSAKALQDSEQRDEELRQLQAKSEILPIRDFFFFRPFGIVSSLVQNRLEMAAVSATTVASPSKELDANEISLKLKHLQKDLLVEASEWKAGRGNDGTEGINSTDQVNSAVLIASDSHSPTSSSSPTDAPKSSNVNVNADANPDAQKTDVAEVFSPASSNDQDQAGVEATTDATHASITVLPPTTTTSKTSDFKPMTLTLNHFSLGVAFAPSLSDKLRCGKPKQSDPKQAIEMTATPTDTIAIPVNDEESSSEEHMNMSTDPTTGAKKLTLLRDVTVSFAPGEMWAIMGGSGSGKSTLLGALTKRLDDSGDYFSSGDYLLNNETATKNEAEEHIGYVAQQDFLLPSLSVRETIKYAARLRLQPASVKESSAETGETGQSDTKWIESDPIKSRVEDIIMELGLRGCADSMVGSDLVRGVSGGEKRRLSVAVQMIARPSVLLLDEPTSGLDSFTAHSVIETLSNIAASGRTVVATLHQPRHDVFSLFTHVLVLSKSYVVYAGPVSGVVPFFNGLAQRKDHGISFPLCPPMANPADWMLDVTSIDSRTQESQRITKHRVETMATLWAKNLASMDTSQPEKVEVDTNKKLEDGKEEGEHEGEKLRETQGFDEALSNRVSTTVLSTGSVSLTEAITPDLYPSSPVTSDVPNLVLAETVPDKNSHSGPVDPSVSSIIICEYCSAIYTTKTLSSQCLHGIQAKPHSDDHQSEPEQTEAAPIAHVWCRIQVDNKSLVEREQLLSSIELSMDNTNTFVCPNGKTVSSSPDLASIGEYLTTVVGNYSRSISSTLTNSSKHLITRNEALEQRSYLGMLYRDFVVLSSRSWRNLLRQPDVLLTRISQIFALGVILAIFYARPNTHQSGISNRIGMLTMLNSFVSVGMLNAVALFPPERNVYYRESEDRLYGVLPFFASYLITELSNEIIGITLALIALVFLGDLSASEDFGKFMFMAYTCLMIVFFGETLGVFFAALVFHVGFAVSLVTTCISVFDSMAGYLNVDSNIWAPFRYINYISPLRYASRLLATIEFENKSLYCLPEELLADGTCQYTNGNQVLAFYEFNPDHKLIYALVLLLTTIAYRTIAVLLLRYKKPNLSAGKA